MVTQIFDYHYSWLLIVSFFLKNFQFSDGNKFVVSTKMIRFVKEFMREYKIVRGMLAYSILWPIGSMAQQTFVEGKNFRTYDYKKCAM